MSRLGRLRKKESGLLISTPIDSDKKREVGTHHCVHCGRTWIARPGSGKRRGFCLKCCGITCGNHRCDTCVPRMQQIENIEAGRPRQYKPITILVPGINEGE